MKFSDTKEAARDGLENFDSEKEETKEDRRPRQYKSAFNKKDVEELACPYKECGR